MAHQLIVTSAKQGLEGGTGDQAVLRSAGMPPQVASRLKAAGGYSHPFPHGDRRNPRVYVHRIEEAAGKTWHVLGCIRDVGSDHTGRSNFLAHMLAADQAEARGKKGGPAAVMAAANLFVESWQGPPDGAAQTKVLMAGDETPVKGSCPAWTRAGLDPGLAGDLAMHAAAGKQVVIVTRPGDDDVLGLFRDALKLVEPGKRWSVTFNTCAIESFNGIWKAIRDDLPQARGLRDSPGAVVIDLTKSPRGSDETYARFARGEADVLPWQGGAKPSQTAAVIETAAAFGPAAGQPPSTGPIAGQTHPGGIRSGRKGIEGPVFVAPREESQRKWWVGPAVLVAVPTIFLGLLAAYVFRDVISDALWPESAPSPIEVAKPKEAPSGPTPEEMAREEEQRRKEAIAQARQQLKDAWGSRTADGIRGEAERLVREVEKLRKGTETEQGLRITLDGVGDPTEIATRAIAAAEQADKVVRQPEEAVDFVANLEAAAKELAAAAGLLEATVKRVPEIAAAERTTRDDAMRQQQDAAAEKSRRDAFEAFKKQGSITVELPVPDLAQSHLTGKPDNPPVSLGPFAAQDLVEPSLQLAVPEDTLNGVPFAAEIVQAAADRWEIKVTNGYTGLDGQPQTIAALEVRSGMLVLEVVPQMLGKRPVAILRRCVILAGAKDPDGTLPLVREIRLVKPKSVGLLRVAAAAGKQAIEVPVPPDGTAANTKLPISGIEVVGEWGGKRETTRLPEQGTPDQPGIVSWAGVQLGQLGDGVMLELKIDLSLPQATFAATPVLKGPNSAGFKLEKMADFLEKEAKNLPNVKETFDKRVTKCPGRDFKKAQGSSTEVEGVKAWFTKPLATAVFMKLDLPGHETIQSSMDLYLRAEYGRLTEEKRVQWERDVANEKDENQKKAKRAAGPGKPDFPNGFDDWFTRCAGAKEQDWPREFESRLNDWSDWFWQTFETHWKTTETLANKLNQQADVRLLEITSIARDPDDPSKEYRVPLVQFDPAAPVTRTAGAKPAAAAGKAAVGSDPEPTAAPARATGL
jgi:hypothetical protein